MLRKNGHPQYQKRLYFILSLPNYPMFSVQDKEGKGILFYCLTATKRHLTALKIALEHDANVNNVVSDATDMEPKCSLCS